MKTITARFKSHCRGCNGVIKPGDVCAFEKGRGTFCAPCAAKGAEVNPQAESVARYSSGARTGLVVTRFNSGATITRNSRGLCEDAPCCGCCS